MSNSDVQLSKALSTLLRHAALKGEITLNSDGFISVTELLTHKRLEGFTLDDIKRVVATNDKQRFSLRERQGVLQIRANQGHSSGVAKDLELEPITDPDSVPNVIHGTYLTNLDSIKQNGLSRMSRNHIHFTHNLPNRDSVISGIRRNAQVLIYIDLKRALDGGIKFYKSANGVILSPGNKNGILESKFFKNIVIRK